MGARGWIAFVLMLAACGRHSGSGDDTGGVYDRIEVEPAMVTLSVPIGGTVTQDYTVFGVVGNDRKDITATCALTVDSTFGVFTDATVTVGPHGGKTLVTAGCGDLTGTGDLLVNLTGKLVTPGTPNNAPDLFTTATTGTDPARTPAIEYPIDHAVSPRNIPPIEMQWTAGANDLYHIALASDFLAVDVYTTNREAMLSAPDWEAIAGSAAGSNLTIVVEGLSQADPAMKFASPSAAITMTKDNIDKTAIYWWASSQGSIMTQTFGTTTAPGLVKDDCTSCHSVSRNGNRVGYSRCVGGDCGQLYAGFMKYDAVTSTWSEPVNANAKAIQGSYTTFAPIGNPFPTDAQAVSMVSLRSGTLALYDPDTGAAIASNLTVSSHGPGAPRSALMADWSADGTKVVYTSTPHPGQWIDLDDGRIAVMSYAYSGGAHQFTEPTFLVPDPITLPGGVYKNFFFPSFSPDGELVVFNAARSAWRNSTDAKTAGQRLMLAATSGAWVQDLTAINGGNGDMDITWAHWAPTASNDYYWIVFSSERDYGHRTTVGTSPASCKANGVKQCKQIWLGAVAKNRLTGAIDPSAPPMWLPGQDSAANNISPYWSVPAGIQ
ncbi:hypothetical protein BH11MYX3_BH11MYX3_16670 [soil metagenome]